MQYDNFTINGLYALHGGIARALAADDAQPPGFLIYGVRIYADWRQHKDGIEAAMNRKGLPFQPLAF
jgi:hypothetical protein